MKASDFKKFIEKAKKVVPQKTTVKAFELCLIQNGWAVVRNDKVQLEMKITDLPSSESPFCFRFYEFERIVTKLKDAPLVIDNLGEDINIESTKGMFRIKAEKVDEFDWWEVVEGTDLVDMYNDTDLAELIKCLSYVGGFDKPIGLQQIRSEDGKFLATDGHFLRFRQRNTTSIRAYNIPPHAVELLSETPLTIHEAGNAFFVASSPSCVVKACQVQAMFPAKWESVIPREDSFGAKLTLDPVWLKETLDLAKMQAGVANACAFSLKKDDVIGGYELTLESKDDDLKRSFKRTTSVQGEGRDIKIGYKIDFLERVLKTEKPDAFELKITSESHPSVMNDYLLIMPCLIS